MRAFFKTQQHRVNKKVRWILPILPRACYHKKNKGCVPNCLDLKTTTKLCSTFLYTLVLPCSNHNKPNKTSPNFETWKRISSGKFVNSHVLTKERHSCTNLMFIRRLTSQFIQLFRKSKPSDKILNLEKKMSIKTPYLFL